MRSFLAEGRVKTSWHPARDNAPKQGRERNVPGVTGRVMKLVRYCCVAGIVAAALVSIFKINPILAGAEVTGSLPKEALPKDALLNEQSGTVNGSASGLPVPRFVSLKSDHVNVRSGPTKDNDVSWIYTKSGLPVEVTAEFENWRRIRDSEGSEGWVYHSLLSGRRTAVVTTKSRDGTAPVFDRADSGSSVAARLEAGVVATVRKCSGTWCRISGGGFDGWIQQERLWGVYPDEKVD